MDVSTVIKLRRLAKDGPMAAFVASRPGRPASVEQVESEELRAENAGLSEALKEVAVELSLHRGWQRSGIRPGPRWRERRDQARAVGLIDRAVKDGWPHLRAWEALGVADVRVHGRRARVRETGSLEDRAPVGSVVHRIPAWEERRSSD